jgi:chemotaxis protein methyltransferase CheR
VIDDDRDIRSLLETVYERYQYDFRGYAMASLRRRVPQAADRLGCRSIAELDARLKEDAQAFGVTLQYLTVPVSDLFRDPLYFKAVRTHVVPVLRTYPSLKIWIPGCSTGEEAYSFAILLKEEELLERAIIYGTDINPESLRVAEAGRYSLTRFQQFTDNHRISGGQGSLSAHYQAAHGAAILDRTLNKRIVFSDHSLATDSVFAEVHLISCRNVLIYFNRDLQNRAVGLFTDALCRKGFLGLGARETLRFTSYAHRFADVQRNERLYQKVS